MIDFRRATTYGSRMLHRPDAPRGFLRRACLRGLQSLLGASGLASLYVRARGLRGATLLCYHGVSEPESEFWADPRYRLSAREFDAQMCFLSRRRRVVSLTRLAEALEEGEDLPAGTVAMTFDDGYLSNLTLAAPILEKYGLPATFMLPTGYVRRAQAQWADRLYGLFQTRSVDRLKVGGREIDLRDPRRERDAYRAASLALLEAAFEEREMLLDDFEAQMRPAGRPPRMTMTWDDVRALARRSPLFEIGGHTRDHVDLRTHTHLAAEEIAECVAEIRAELGTGPAHFSFPYGRWTTDAQAQLQSRGFRSSVGSGTDFLITSKSDRFALPPLDPRVSPSRFRYMTSGAHPGLTRALVGRA
jgi:peptidoglycan/xylan/chitin deacetylase (PgdA/CDA1 family)